MARFPETRISLIMRLATADDAEAWREFASLYAPTVFSIARRRGLQNADAEEVVQELLIAVARMAERWQTDPARARFRTWLYRVAGNLLANHFRVSLRTGKRVLPLDAHQLELADQAQCSDEFSDVDVEWERALYHMAAKRVRSRVSETTWLAFERTTVDELPVNVVAEQLKMRLGNLYVARSRVMKMLRLEIERMQANGCALSLIPDGLSELPPQPISIDSLDNSVEMPR